MKKQVRWISIVALAVVMAPAAASGQPAASEPLWHEGVSAEQKAKATVLFKEAFARHQDRQFSEARDLYEQAVEDWDNPDIRYNLGLLYESMGLPLRAYDNLRRALDWGDQGIIGEQRTHALSLLEALLTDRLSIIDVHCNEQGARVAVDGELVLVGPGTTETVVLPGKHVITAEKDGYFSVLEVVTQAAGKRNAVTVTLSEDREIYRRRWAPWKPWAVSAGGAATMLVGAGLRWRASSNVTRAENLLEDTCDDAPLCDPAAGGAYSAATWQNRFASGSFAVGGAAIVTGLALAWLNRPGASRTRNRGGARVETTGIVWRNGAGLTTRIVF